VCVYCHHFVVIDEDFKNRGLATIFRMGNEFLVGDELHSLLCSVGGATLFFDSDGVWMLGGNRGSAKGR
jgi:hypothetical protein